MKVEKRNVRGGGEFTRKRSRKESRSLADVRASRTAEKMMIKDEKDEEETNQNHVHFQLYVGLIERREKLLEFGSFVEDHDELFVILLLSKIEKRFFYEKENKKKRT